MMFKVFIAEDEPASMEYIKNIIQFKCPEFYVAGQAHDGAEALEKLLENPVDVLISDVEMDDVNGIELITQLGEIYPQTHSIIVSGYSDFTYMQGALRARAVDYILKPINVQQMVDLLNKIAEKLRKTHIEEQSRIWSDYIGKQQPAQAVDVHAKTLDLGEFPRVADNYLQSGNIAGFKDELARSFNIWEKESYNALQIVRALELLFVRISKFKSPDSYYDYQEPLATALYTASSMQELMSMVWDIIAKLLELNSSIYQSTGDLFELIGDYISRHYMEPLSLDGICRRFNISQTYLSRLFRKHKEMTFNDYLTVLRVERAKEIIAKNRDIKLKDVAQMVGYPDSSYFSKVFRQHVGCSPSQYSP